MLVNSVVIILREVLEASLVLSVLMVVCRLYDLGQRWIVVALAGGLLGSLLLGMNMASISDLFDGVGQELADAALQFGVYFLLVVCVFRLVRSGSARAADEASLLAIMTMTVALAITREGSEVLIYVTGFWQMENFMSGVGLGSFVGACIGISVGVLFYYFLLSQSRNRAIWLSLGLLTLVGSGMCAQATGLLIQADWLSVSSPLWDTSGLLPEDSLVGQLMYALMGYEATPSTEQVVIYASSLISFAAVAWVGVLVSRSRQGPVLRGA